MSDPIQIAPSILAADYARISEELAQVSSADLIHFDVMDGHFVPNISFGADFLRAVKASTDLPVDAHLMVSRPGRYAPRFCDDGADLVCIHVEADQPHEIISALKDIRARGVKTGIALKPATPGGIVLPFLEYADMVLVMTVEPGFGGQSFMADMLPKLRGVRALAEQYHPGMDIEVDGGIDERTAPLVVDSGANVLVAGSAVFGKADRAAAVSALRMASDVKA